MLYYIYKHSTTTAITSQSQVDGRKALRVYRVQSKYRVFTLV